MQEKELTILNAALDKFAHYGVKRTTMADIAEAAGIARQTLYNSFPNKDAVLRGTIQMYVHNGLAAFNKCISESSSLENGLDVAYEQISRKPYEVLRNTAHGDEIMEGLNAVANDELNEAYRVYRALISQILKPYEAQILEHGFSLDQLSDVIVISLTSFKKSAESIEHLEQLYAPFKGMVLHLVAK